MICIYKIENQLNKKVYIGQTNNYKSRIYDHKYTLRKNKSACRKLQYSWNKYGESSFKFEMIEPCTKDLLNEKEIYWISFYDSITKGYNLEKGGKLNKKLSEETKKLMSINNPRVWKGKFGKDHNASKKVYRYDLEGNYVDSFISVVIASENTKINKRAIANAATNVLQSAGGYQWSYEKLDRLEKYIKIKAIPYNEKKIVMVDSKTNKDLKIFDSMVIAAKYLEIDNPKKNKIYLVCNGVRQHYANYKWRWY